MTGPGVTSAQLAWALWRAAEALMEAGAPLDAATRALPARQAWLLRAMAALHDGHTATVERCASEAEAAGQHDIGTILRLLLLQAGQPPATYSLEIPSEDRAQLDRWECVRCLMSWRQGKNPRGGRTLTSLRPGRPALGAWLDLVGKTATKIHRAPDLALLSRRAEAVFLAGRGTILRWPNLRKSLATLGETGLDLSRYPDLEAAEDRGALPDWIAGKCAWAAPQDRAVARLLTRPLAERKRALAGLLGALPARLRAGGAVVILDAAHAASLISGTQPEWAVLTEQLAVATRRMRALVQGGDVDLLAGLWARAAAWPLAERAAIAAAVDKLPSPPAGLLHSVLPVRLIGGDKAARRDAVSEAAERLSRPELEALLAPLPPLEREELLVIHALENDQPGPALRGITVLLRDPATSAYGAPLLKEVLESWPERTGAPLQARLEEAFDALSATPLSAAHLVSLWTALHTSEARGLRLLTRLREACRRAPPPPEGSPEQGATVALHLLMGETDAARDRVRALGRLLRAMKEADAADDLALEVLGRAMFAASVLPEPTVEPVLAPLSAFLLREGPARLLRGLDRIAATRSEACIGLVHWCTEHEARLGPRIAFAPVLARLLRASAPEGALEALGIADLFGQMSGLDLDLSF